MSSLSRLVLVAFLVALASAAPSLAREATPARSDVAVVLGSPAARRVLLGIARASMETFVGNASPPNLHQPPRPTDGRLGALVAACFVTIEVDGQVRGCRGTLTPGTASLVDEVRHNAVAAAIHDPRFAPLAPRDLRRGRISISVVVDLEPCAGIDDLPREDGLVVRQGDRVGVVLPYEGRDPAVRLEWAYRKAGISSHEACDIQRMRAIRFAEEDIRP